MSFFHVLAFFVFVYVLKNFLCAPSSKQGLYGRYCNVYLHLYLLFLYFLYLCLYWKISSALPPAGRGDMAAIAIFKLAAGNISPHCTISTMFLIFFGIYIFIFVIFAKNIFAGGSKGIGSETKRIWLGRQKDWWVGATKIVQGAKLNWRGFKTFWSGGKKIGRDVNEFVVGQNYCFFLQVIWSGGQGGSGWLGW